MARSPTRAGFGGAQGGATVIEQEVWSEGQLLPPVSLENVLLSG